MKIDTWTARDRLDYFYNLYKPGKSLEEQYNDDVVELTRKSYEDYFKMNEKLRKKERALGKMRNE